MDAAPDNLPFARDPYAAELHAIADRIEAARASDAEQDAALAEAQRMASAAIKDLLADAFERGRSYERRVDVPAAVLRLEERDTLEVDGRPVPHARFSLADAHGDVLESDFHTSVRDALVDLAEKWDAREAEAHAL